MLKCSRRGQRGGAVDRLGAAFSSEQLQHGAQYQTSVEGLIFQHERGHRVCPLFSLRSTWGSLFRLWRFPSGNINHKLGKLVGIMSESSDSLGQCALHARGAHTGGDSPP